MRRVDVFVYVADALSVVWFLVAPSYQSMGALGIMIVGGLMLLYIAKTRNGGQPV